MDIRTELQRQEFILFAMFKKKITKLDLAKSLNLSYPTMLDRLNNTGSFKIKEAIRLCGILNINVIDLITLNNFENE